MGGVLEVPPEVEESYAMQGRSKADKPGGRQQFLLIGPQNPANHQG